MTGLIVALSVIGASLPSLGVFRVYLRARGDERKRRELVASRGGNVGATVGDFSAVWAGVHAPNSRLRIALLDALLVVAGLVCTATASIIGAAT